MPFIQPSTSSQPSFEPETDRDRLKSQIKDFIWETLKVIVISLAIIIPVRYFLIQPFYVKGASMEPNFYDHEYLIIDEISYRFHPPARGDVIVFKYPYDKSQYFIKRIIGLPNETVTVADGQVTIINEANPDGFVLNEDLYLSGVHTQGADTIVLNQDQYYLMGDNRSASLDSRMFGPVNQDDIIGRTWIRGWPVNRITVFNDPAY
jgi:signal peptidase I